jgi:hypothetical protein
VVVHHGLEERRTPGNTLAVQPDKPYQSLASFGTGEPARQARPTAWLLPLLLATRPACWLAR